MEKIDYLKMLEDGHSAMDEIHGYGRTSRHEYLSEHIFQFIAYENRMAELFASKALDVCVAITERKVFDYLGDSDENRMWFLLMCNMPFFANRIDWGTSVRCAWWVYPVNLGSEALFLGGQQVSGTMVMGFDEWREFVSAMVDYAGAEIHRAIETRGASDEMV